MRRVNINNSSFQSEEYIKMCREFKIGNKNPAKGKLKPVFKFLLKMVLESLAISQECLPQEDFNPIDLNEEFENENDSVKITENKMIDEKCGEEVDSDASILDYLLGETKVYSPSKCMIGESIDNDHITNLKNIETDSDRIESQTFQEEVHNQEKETNKKIEMIDNYEIGKIISKDTKRKKSKCWISRLFGCY